MRSARSSPGSVRTFAELPVLEQCSGRTQGSGAHQVVVARGLCPFAISPGFPMSCHTFFLVK
jgi:hypothetical protein